MRSSDLNKLATAYAQIAEGGKHEKNAMDWNKSDDKPKGKVTDKKKVDKCTCESFYLKRLEAMNPELAEVYRDIAMCLISEGYESARLLDNIIEALPAELVGHEFVSALKAVNPRIHENLQSAEKRQARAIVEQQYKGQNALQAFGSIMKNSIPFIGGGAAGVKADADKHKRNFYARQEKNKPGYNATVDQNQAARDSAQGTSRTNDYFEKPATTETKPKDTKPAEVTSLASQQPSSERPPSQPRNQGTGERSAEANRARQEAAKNAANARRTASSAPAQTASASAPAPKPKPTGPITSRAAIAGGSKEGQGPKSKVSTYRDPKDTKGTSIGRYRTLAQHRAAVAKNKANEECDWRSELDELDEGLKQARKNVGADTCWDGYKAKGTKKKNGRDVPNCVKEEETVEEEKKGLWANIHAKRKSGRKKAQPGDKNYPKTLDIEEGAMSKDKEDHDTGGFRISDKEAKEAKDRLKKKKNIRGYDSEEQKKRLEKKRGMKLDDHPQFKKEDYDIYDILLTFLDENYILESVEDAEEVMMQLTGAQIVEIIDEYMNMAEANSAGKTTNNNKKTTKVAQSTPADRARRAVQNQRDGYHGDDDALNKGMEALQKSLNRLKGV